MYTIEDAKEAAARKIARMAIHKANRHWRFREYAWREHACRIARDTGGHAAEMHADSMCARIQFSLR